jgi:Uma2 family endonuclease
MSGFFPCVEAELWGREDELARPKRLWLVDLAREIYNRFMAGTTNQLLTVEEFRRLPEEEGPVYHELRHGEVVAVTRPKLKHHLIQSRLRDRIKALAPTGSFVEYEVAFRALPEYELRVADVAFISPERIAQVDPNDNPHGAPDLVIEVLSPSNTVAEIYDKEKLCLENGAQEFWIVDPDRSQVKVSTPDGRTVTYQSGQEIPMPLFGPVRLLVDFF